MINQKVEREREEARRRTVEKDKLLSKRVLQINTLQGRTEFTENIISIHPKLL